MYIRIRAEALLRGDLVRLARIAVDGAVQIDAHAVALQPFLEVGGGGLPAEARDDDGGHLDAFGAQIVDELEGGIVVGDAEVGADALALDVVGVDADDEIGVGGEVLQEAQLDVGVEAGEDPRRMEVADQLAAELQVEAAGAALDTLADGGGLCLKV